MGEGKTSPQALRDINCSSFREALHLCTMNLLDMPYKLIYDYRYIKA
jgi:hypothetical protein